MEQGRGGLGTGLREGQGAGHAVQFYGSDGFLTETVGKFVADGIRERLRALVSLCARRRVTTSKTQLSPETLGIVLQGGGRNGARREGVIWTV